LLLGGAKVWAEKIKIAGWVGNIDRERMSWMYHKKIKRYREIDFDLTFL
jgi:hypothetical protein